MCLFFVKALKQPFMNGLHGCNCFDYSADSIATVTKIKGNKNYQVIGMPVALNKLFELKEHVSLRSRSVKPLQLKKAAGNSTEINKAKLCATASSARHWGAVCII